jgi:hypothetical protein
MPLLLLLLPPSCLLPSLLVLPPSLLSPGAHSIHLSLTLLRGGMGYGAVWRRTKGRMVRRGSVSVVAPWGYVVTVVASGAVAVVPSEQRAGYVDTEGKHPPLSLSPSSSLFPLFSSSSSSVFPLSFCRSGGGEAVLAAGLWSGGRSGRRHSGRMQGDQRGRGSGSWVGIGLIGGLNNRLYCSCINEDLWLEAVATPVSIKLCVVVQSSLATAFRTWVFGKYLAWILAHRLWILD